MNGQRDGNLSVCIALDDGAAAGFVRDRVNRIGPAALVMIDNQHGSNRLAVSVDHAQRSSAGNGNTCQCKQSGSAKGNGTEPSRDHRLQIVADTMERAEMKTAVRNVPARP
jgi:hypothetical protein